MGRFSWLEIAPAEAEQTAPSLPATLASDGSSFAAQALTEANKLLTEGLYSQALRQYSRAIDEDKDNLEAWLGQTLCQLALDEKEQAAVWAKHMRERFPNEPEADCAWHLTQSALGHAPEEIASWLQRQDAPDSPALPPFCAYAQAVCLFNQNQAEAGQSALASLLQKLSTRTEQMRWVLLVADFLLHRRLADGTCALLEALYEAQELNTFGLSMWIKAEWLRGDGNRAQLLLDAMRQRDAAAVTVYGVDDYMKEETPAVLPGIKQYLMNWINRFSRDKD